MTLYQLRIFSLASKMNFIKVAETLYTSPSSVTKYIAQLESELGNPLFIRSNNKIELSSFGKEFLPYAESIIAMEDDALQFASNRKSRKSLRVLAVDHLIFAFRDSLTQKLIQAGADYEKQSGNHVDIEYQNHVEARADLNTGNADLLIAQINNIEMPGSFVPGWQQEKLLHIRHYLVIPETLFYNSAPSGRIEEDIAYISSLMYIENPSDHRRVRDMISYYNTSLRLIPINHWAAMIMRLASGNASALISEDLLDLVPDHCFTYLLDENKFSSGLYMITRARDDRESVKGFMKTLKEAFS